MKPLKWKWEWHFVMLLIGSMYLFSNQDWTYRTHHAINDHPTEINLKKY